MATALNKEHCLARIRNKLQDSGVKLWTSPYYVDGHVVLEELKELAFNYSDILAIPHDFIFDALCTLQNNALEKLATRLHFQQTGVATLRVKAVGGTAHEKNICIQLSKTGEVLEQELKSQMGLGCHTRLKLICNGQVLSHSESLEAQRVINNSLVLAIVLSSDPESQKMEEMVYHEVELIKADADLLANQQDENYLRIADQSGNIMQLPFEEKKSLAVAIALHEKGRSALKRNQVSLALTLFHEADSKFTSCRSELLNCVDNAALLNLDIAWCYLLLGNAADIPNASIRLQRCEQSLYKTYGAQMERLLTLKGTTGNEGVLFVRLHLLQGVVAFHQGKTLEATKLLNQAKEELQKLSVSDADLTQLIGLGYSLTDARLGLRACRGDLNAACVYLQRRMEERKERKRREKEEEELDRERKKLGKTANNQWVNLGYLKTIVEMGYDRSKAAEGLKRTNNDISRTLELIQNESFASQDSIGHYSEESVAQIVSMGFTVDQANEMLLKHNGDLEFAVEELAANLGRPEQRTASSSSKTEEEKNQEKEAYERLSKDIPKSEEDHLDTGLELESEYLYKYLAYLN